MFHYFEKSSLQNLNPTKYLKLGLSPSKKNVFVCFNESRFQMMKNAFYFILKALLFLKILSFCLDFLVIYKNEMKKEKVNFEIYDVTTWLTSNYNKHIAQYLTK